MRRPLLLALALAALASCTAQTPVGGPTPTITANSVAPTPSATGSKKPRLPTARFAVYARDDGLWRYDVKADEVTQIARGANIRAPRILTEDEISFVQDSRDEPGAPSTLRILDLRTREVRDVFSVRTGIRVYGWSPDHQTVAYVTTDSRGYPHIEFRDLGAVSAVRPAGTLARALGRGVSDDDQLRVQFSPDGQYVLVVYTYADGVSDDDVTEQQTQLQVRTAQGTLAHAAAHQSDPTMGMWAPDGSRVYYRTDRGGRFWTVQTGRVTVLPGRPIWYDPWISPDGTLIAYDTGAGKAGVRVRLYDLVRAGSRAVGQANRVSPVMASRRTIWAQKVRRCRSECLGETERVDQVVAIDVRSGKEKPIALPQTVGIDVYYR